MCSAVVPPSAPTTDPVPHLVRIILALLTPEHVGQLAEAAIERLAILDHLAELDEAEREEQECGGDDEPSCVRLAEPMQRPPRYQVAARPHPRPTRKRPARPR